MILRALTLIEVLVYIGLFSFLMTGIVFSLHLMGQTAHKNHQHSMLLQEADFLTTFIRHSLQTEGVVPEQLPTSFFVSYLSLQNTLELTSPHISPHYAVTFTLQPAETIAIPQVATTFQHFIYAP